MSDTIISNPDAAKYPGKNKIVRVFFAIELPEDVKTRLAKVIEELKHRPRGKKVSWVSPEKLHMTLRFIGDIAVDHLPQVIDAIASVINHFTSFKIQLGSLHVFPTLAKPRIISTEIYAPADLTNLAAGIENTLVKLGITPETREFRAHLTLGRIRDRRYPPLNHLTTSYHGAFAIERIALLQSDQAARGTVYTVLKYFPLL